MDVEDKSFAILRILAGVVWLIDAASKLSPAFFSNFTSYLAHGAAGQPALVQAWVDLWVRGAGVNPHFFAIVVVVSEMAIAIGLIFGLLTDIALIGGIAMTLVIWSTAQGFGGPYVAGSTEIGSTAVYAITFIALWIGKSWRAYSIDSVLKGKLPALYRHW